MLRELGELNVERNRKDEDMKRTYIKPDDRRSIKRLEEFVEKFHSVIIEVEFLKVFEIYQEVVNVKS